MGQQSMSDATARTLDDPSAHDHLLEVDELRTWFDTPSGVVRAVDGVSLTVDRGRTLGIVGESGSGKTVLARSIMRLLPGDGVLHSGSIRFNGSDLLKTSERDLRSIRGSQLSMVFQDPMTSLHPVTRIGSQITDVLRLHVGLDKAAAKHEAIELLRAVHLSEPERRFREYPHQLSGGMRQRVMIAIAIACRPKLLLADEPTTALDVSVQAQILDLIQEQQRALDMAVILVSHDLGVVAHHTDEIAVMYAGKVVERAPTRALFRETRMPYTHALLNSIPRLDRPMQTLSVIPGLPPDRRNRPTGCQFAPRCVRATERCSREEPPLQPAETPGHFFACWHPMDPPNKSSNAVVASMDASTVLAANPGGAA